MKLDEVHTVFLLFVPQSDLHKLLYKQEEKSRFGMQDAQNVQMTLVNLDLSLFCLFCFTDCK